jgi:hypothetical protein
LTGTPSRNPWLTLAKNFGYGIALSLAKLQVALEAAQQIEMAQKMPIMKTAK